MEWKHVKLVSLLIRSDPVGNPPGADDAQHFVDVLLMNSSFTNVRKRRNQFVKSIINEEANPTVTHSTIPFTCADLSNENTHATICTSLTLCMSCRRSRPLSAEYPKMVWRQKRRRTAATAIARGRGDVFISRMAVHRVITCRRLCIVQNGSQEKSSHLSGVQRPLT